MNENRPPISVIIRIRNEREFLEQTIEALCSQSVTPELIVVDNDSSDGSAETARAAGALVVSISREDFSYGRALNLGIAAASADVVLLLSAHSVPIGPTFLEACLAPFSDSTVGGAFCLRSSFATEWYKPPFEVRGPADWNAILRVPFSNACSVIRKTTWRQVPFHERLESCEDQHWAYRVVEAGQKIVGCRAIYVYDRPLTWREGMRTFNRDCLATYRISGLIQPRVRLRDVLRAALLNVPKSAFSTVISTVIRYAAVKTVPMQARFEARLGSDR